MNPFAKKDTSPTPKLSAWERKPAAFREICAEIAKKSGKISPQNKRVISAAERFCREKGIPIK